MKVVYILVIVLGLVSVPHAVWSAPGNISEYTCISTTQIYPYDGNRVVAEFKEGRTINGYPDETGRWLVVTKGTHQYVMDLSDFISAEKAHALEDEKQQKLARLDERIAEIQQELKALTEASIRDPNKAMGSSQGPPNVTQEDGTGKTQPPDRIMSVSSSKKTIKEKLLEKELRRLEKKRVLLARK